MKLKPCRPFPANPFSPVVKRSGPSFATREVAGSSPAGSIMGPVAQSVERGMSVLDCSPVGILNAAIAACLF